MAGRFVVGSAWVALRADADGLRAEIKAKVDAATAGLKAEVKLDVDRSTASRVLATVGAVGDDSGDHFARRFSQSSGRGINRDFKIFATQLKNSMQLLNFGGLVTPMNAVIAAAVAAAPAVAALGSSLGLASLSAAAAVPAMFGLAGVVGMLKLGFGGISDTMTEYGNVQEQLRKGTITQAEANAKLAKILADLRPSVRGLVVEMVHWKDNVLRHMGEVIQDTLLPSITKLMITARMHVPVVTQFMKDLAASTASAADQMRVLIASPMFTGQLRVITAGNAIAMGNLFASLTPLFQTLMNIAVAAMPLFIRFSAWVLEIANHFAIWTSDTERLANVFNRAGDELAIWGAILGNFAAGLFFLFSAATPAGHQMALSLKEISEEFKNWAASDETRAKVRAFFDWFMNLPWGNIFQAVAAFTALYGALRLLTSVTGGLQLLFSLFAAGPVGLVIAGIGALAAMFIYAYTHSEEFRKRVNELGAQIWDAWINKILPALQGLKEATDRLLDAAGLKWQDVFNIISFVIMTSINTITFFIQAVTFMVNIVASQIEFLKGAWNLAGAVISAVIGFLIDRFQQFANFIFSAFDFIKGVWNAWMAFWTFVVQDIVAFAGFLATKFGELANWVFSKFDFMKGVWDAARAFWNFIVTAIVGVIDFLANKFTQLANWVFSKFDFMKGVWQAAKDFFGTIVGGIGSALDWLGAKFNSVIEFILGVFHKFRGGAQGVKDHFISTWNAIAGALVVGANAIIDFLNSVIGKLNAILPNDIPKIPRFADGGPVFGFARGGPVYGGGGPRSDTIPAWLSSGEHVFTAEDVQNMGGHQGVMAFRRMLKTEGPLLGKRQWAYASGGGVGVDSTGAIIQLAKTSGINFSVSSARRSTNDYHGTGNAVDLVSTHFGMANLAHYFMGIYNRLLELIHGDSQSFVKNGKKVPASYYGAATVAQHASWGNNEHVHVAATLDSLAGLTKFSGVGGGGLIGDLLSGPIEAIFSAMTAPFKKILDGLGKGIPGDSLRGIAGGAMDGLKDTVMALIGFSGGGGAATVGGKLGDWMRTALKILGLPDSWLGPLQTLIMRESGGNPRAINNVDSNAMRGDPSRGLMQTIGATFNSYRLPSLSGDIYDPVSNIVAGLRYIQARYGSIFNVQQANANMPPRGYGFGTDGASAGWHVINEHGQEAINFRGGEKVAPIGNVGTINVTLAFENITEIRNIEEFLNRIQQAARASGSMS